MSTAARKRVISLLAGACVLAAAAGGFAFAQTSGGGARAVTLAGSEHRVVPDGLFRPIIAMPRYTPPAAPHRAQARAEAAAAAKPPPVVDGVRRSNVGAAHSPKLRRALSNGPQRPPGSLPPGAGSRGIDVASYQHPHGAGIDWGRVARAGYKFVFIKAAEGNYYANPYFSSDLAEAKAAGLYATGYIFAVPNVSSGGSQARYAVAHARGRTMPVALDIEYNPYGRECYGLSASRMVGWLAAFSGEVRRLTGHRPVIYSTADWWRSCTGDSRAFGADPLWVAAWGTSSPPMPSGWRNWTFWQYTSRGRVPGIRGNVDLSYYRRRLPAPPSSRPSPAPSSPTPVPSSPTPVPSSPSPTPSSPTPVPSSPSPTPSSPSPTPSSPTPVPSSPSPVPSGTSPTPSSPVQPAGSQPRN